MDLFLSDNSLDLAGNIDHLIPFGASNLNFVQYAATSNKKFSILERGTCFMSLLIACSFLP